MSNSEPQQKTTEIVEAALERNARQPIALDVHELTSYTDTLVLLTGGSGRQVRAISDNIVKRLKELGDSPLGIEGTEEGRWVLIDANDIIVHVFEHEAREQFNLEGLWSDAPRIDLPLPPDVDQEAG